MQLCIPAFIIFFFALGCGDDGGSRPDAMPPTVFHTVPANGAENILVNSAIKVWFSEYMDPKSIDSSTFGLYEYIPADCVSSYGTPLTSLSDLRSVPCSVSSDGFNAKLKPHDNLQLENLYTAMISSNVRDMAGNRMAEPYSWSFRTGSYSPLPSFGVKVAIGSYEDVYQGHYADVYISLQNDSTEIELGLFNLVMTYDADALVFMGAELSDTLAGCWEYFTYRWDWTDDCGGPCPSGLLRIVGIADINNGPTHPDPSCILFPSGTETDLFKLNFYVTDDRTYECIRVPIRFFWLDCDDNALSKLFGDTVWLSRHVYDYDPMTHPPFIEITGESHFGGHWWLGECEYDGPYDQVTTPLIDFYNGGVSIICADSIDGSPGGPGDLNLNGRIEISDAVLYTNYFIYGMTVLGINPEEQVAASEVNMDGEALTVADLVYMVRIITGDALPYSKLTPYANTANILVDGSLVSSESSVDIGAVLFVFDIDGEIGTPTLLADGMDMKSDTVLGQLRVLLYDIGGGRLPAGAVDLLSLGTSGTVTLADVEFSDYYGNMMNVVAR